MPRPRGGDWLEDEIRAWRTAGVDRVVSLLTPDEVTALELDPEATECRAAGIEYVSVPIPDRSVPASRLALNELVTHLGEQLARGEAVAVHCRQDIGRAALAASCLLILGGLDPDSAMQRVGTARGCPVPETPDQRRWVVEYASSLAPRA